MSGWVLVLVVIGTGALPATRMESKSFNSATACHVALADLQRQITPAPHRPQPHTPPPRLVGGCYPK